MSEFKGQKTYEGSSVRRAASSCYTQEYVDWLQERIATLTKSNQALRKQLQAFRRTVARDYRDQADHLPYAEDDRDYGR